MTYEEANQKCKTLGSQLLTVKNSIEKGLITDLVYNKWGKDMDFWLGARKLNKQGNYS